MSEELHTAYEWDEILAYGILDYDGFRDGTISVDTKITKNEFERRAVHATRCLSGRMKKLTIVYGEGDSNVQNVAKTLASTSCADYLVSDSFDFESRLRETKKAVIWDKCKYGAPTLTLMALNAAKIRAYVNYVDCGRTYKV